VHGGDFAALASSAPILTSTQRGCKPAVTPALVLELDDQTNLFQVAPAPWSPSSAVMWQPLKSLSSVTIQEEISLSRFHPAASNKDQTAARSPHPDPPQRDGEEGGQRGKLGG